MSEIKKLDIQPGMSFYQKHQKLYYMITDINKSVITLKKIHDTQGVVTKSVSELQELLQNEQWTQVSYEECISLPDIKAKNMKAKILTQESKISDLKKLENYYHELKKLGEGYNRNKLRERK